MSIRDQVLDRLTSGPIGQKILAQEAEDALAIRRAKVTELRGLEEDHAKAMTPLRAATQSAWTAVEAAYGAWVTAREEHGRASGRERGAAIAYDREKGALEADLIATADPVIDAFIRGVTELWEETRRTPISVSGGTPDVHGNRSPITGNGPAINARLSAINAAREAALSLKLEALDGGEVAKRLAKLRAGIPEAS